MSRWIASTFDPLISHESLLFLFSPVYGHAAPGDDAVVVDDEVDGPVVPELDIAAAGDAGLTRMSCCVEKSSMCGDDEEDIDGGDMAPNGRLTAPPALPAPCNSCAYRMRSGYGTTVCCWCGGGRIAGAPTVAG